MSFSLLCAVGGRRSALPKTLSASAKKASAMNELTLSLMLMLLLFAILGSGVWIAIALAVCGFAAVLTKAATPAGQVLATSMWAASNSWDLTALPMFIWMGEILYRTKLSDDMFEGLAPWVQRLPGRLLHVNVIGCAIFAAVSGSAAAGTTTACQCHRLPGRLLHVNVI